MTHSSNDNRLTPEDLEELSKLPLKGDYFPPEHITEAIKNQNLSSNDSKVRERLEAMYFSAIPTNNLDTGEIEPPLSLEEALNFHLPATQDLINQAVIDSLSGLIVSWYSTPDGVEYIKKFDIEQAINQLRKGQSS